MGLHNYCWHEKLPIPWCWCANYPVRLIGSHYPVRLIASRLEIYFIQYKRKCDKFLFISHIIQVDAFIIVFYSTQDTQITIPSTVNNACTRFNIILNIYSFLSIWHSSKLLYIVFNIYDTSVKCYKSYLIYIYDKAVNCYIFSSIYGWQK